MDFDFAKDSFVLFKLPRTEKIEYLQGLTQMCNDEIEPENFIFADFLGQRYSFANHSITTYSIEDWKNKWICPIDSSLLSIAENKIPTTEEEYAKNVALGIENIRQEVIQKVVFSKIKVHKNHITDLKHSFESLCDAYQETMVCMLYTPTQGLWLGASPEVLLESNAEHIRTVSLAGTQQSMGKLTKDATWSQKEIEEQALVSRYIINCFKSIRLREYEERGPRTIQTGRLFHLKTEYLIDKSEIDITNVESKLLYLLHPTSAVCGMPKQEAVSLILGNESHGRNLYTGFWGPTTKDGFKFFVNIRLVQIFKNQLVYFAGAGITEDSDPHSEWLETEAKCDNLALKLMN